MSSKTKLLVVDDDDSIRRCLRLYLSKDFEIYSASNGKEALELYKLHKMKLIITDLEMPIMDGDQLCREIRELDLDCKIFATSGHHNMLANSSHANIGFTECITKPFKIEKVLTLIKQAEAEL